MSLSVTTGNEAVSVIWIIDSEQWPRALLRAELIERGYDAVGYLTASDALATLGARFPDLIVVDLRGVTREEVENLFKVGVPVIGIASIPEPSWASQFPWAALLRRPVSIGEIVDAVKATLS
jgi:DNA-binding NtrC family response regulator